jgi:hypothetical protein
VSGLPPLTVNGVEYEVAVQINYVFEGGRMTIRTDPPTMEPFNDCEHCHRADWRERRASSLEQAIEYGWLVPL